MNTNRFPVKEGTALDCGWHWIDLCKNCPTLFKCLNGGYRFFFVSTSVFLSPPPVLQNSRSNIDCASMRVLPTVEQSAKCHLSTCALMINTILMVSINFLLHHQKAAVALSLSWPCTCFGKPLCGSCWMEIVCFSLTHSHNFTDRCTKHAHTQSHTLVSYRNTHAHYYMVLCSLHFKHLHADKQIKCNSVF